MIVRFTNGLLPVGDSLVTVGWTGVRDPKRPYVRAGCHGGPLRVKCEACFGNGGWHHDCRECRGAGTLPCVPGWDCTDIP